MHKILRNKQINHRAGFLLYLLAILTLVFIPCQAVDANYSANRGYTPPVDQKSSTSQRRAAAGSRGCSTENNSITLNLLESQETFLSKKTTKPNIAFNISSVPKYPVIITLTQPDKIEPVFETKLNIVHAGPWSVTAQPKSSLLVGQHYVWTVMIVCNNLNPSQNLYFRSLYLVN